MAEFDDDEADEPGETLLAQCRLPPITDVHEIADIRTALGLTAPHLELGEEVWDLWTVELFDERPDPTIVQRLALLLPPQPITPRATDHSTIVLQAIDRCADIAMTYDNYVFVGAYNLSAWTVFHLPSLVPVVY